MTIIQLSGKAGVGKDTFAKQLYIELQREGKKCIILHYADRIKDIARQVYGWNGIKDDEGRKLLQDTGRQGRKISKSLWIKEVHTLIKIAELNEIEYVIIPDCRLIEEIEYWNNKTKYNNIVVKLQRDNFINKLSEENQKDETETELDNYNMKTFIVSDDENKIKEDIENFIKEFKIWEMI